MIRQTKQHQPKPEAAVAAHGMGPGCVVSRIEANGDPGVPVF